MRRFVDSLCASYCSEDENLGRAQPYNDWMPELSRFFGIIVRMYMEAGAPHHSPHFHAYYQDEAAVFSILPVELIAGGLARPQRRLVEAWAELHQAELLANWDRLQAGQPAIRIDPLR